VLRASCPILIPSLFRQGVLSISLAVLPFCATPGTAWADTDHLRELAKNKPRLLIVASGPEAMPLATRLQEAIRANNDFKRGKKPEMARAVNPIEAATLLADPNAPRTSLIVILAGKDLQNGSILPAQLTKKLPLDGDVLGGRVSVVRSVMDSDKAGDAQFRIALYAPDAPRLQRLYDRFTTQRAENYRDLPFTERYTTNRLALFSPPEMKKTLETRSWGHHNDTYTWNEVKRYDLSERASLAPEQLAECTEVYFLDRSHPAFVLPEPAARALETVPVKPTTVAVVRKDAESGANPVVVVSAPSRLLLESCVVRRPSLRTLAMEPVTREAVDLSRIGGTSLLILGGSKLTKEQIASLHTGMSGTMRRDLGIPVEPRGEILTRLEGELAQQMAQGATDTRGLMQRKVPTRFVWVFTVTQVSASTDYLPDMRKLTPEIGEFRWSEPTEPVRGRNESREDFDERWREWRDEYRRWERAREDHAERYRSEPCEWELSVTRQSAVAVRGELQLIDMKGLGGAPVVWEKDYTYRLSDRRVYRTQRATVRGHDNRPDSLEPPAATNDCAPELLLAAATTTGQTVLNTLRDEALLPDPSRPVPLPSTEVSPAPASPAPLPLPARAKIAEVDGQTVTLNVGARHGIRVGDRFEALLKYKDTTDPDSGKVIRTRVIESLILVVTHVDEEACDARPASPADAAKIGKATVRTPARLLSGK
jgi:hypothetical protein